MHHSVTIVTVPPPYGHTLVVIDQLVVSSFVTSGIVLEIPRIMVQSLVCGPGFPR